MSRFLLWCAGADREIIGDRAIERARYVGSGLALLLTALVAGAGMTLLLWQVVGEVAVAVPIAAGWALLIFNIDRLLVSSFNYGPLDATNRGEPPRQNARTRTITYGARLLLALAVALAVAEPAMISLFRPEIDQQLAKTHEEKVKDAKERVRQRLQPERDDIEAALTRAQEDATTAEREAQAAKDAADAEENGSGGTRRVGCDPNPQGACMTKRRAAQAAQKRKEDADAALVIARSKHGTDITAWTAKVDLEMAGEVDKIKGNNGFLASEEALDQVMTEHPSLWVRRILLTFLLIMVDLLPVLVKLFGPPTLHDRLVRRKTAADALAEDGRIDGEIEGQEQQLETDRHNRLLQNDFDRSGAVQRFELQREQRTASHELSLEQLRLWREREVKRLEYEHQMAMRQLNFRYAVTSVADEPPDTDGNEQGDKEQGGVPRRSSRVPRSDQLVLNGRWVVTPNHPHGTDGGGMGETFLAYDIDDPSVKVVAKRFRQAIARDTAQRDRLAAQFEKELTRHSAVDSRYVAPIVDNGDHPEFGTFLVTTYYPDTLALRLRTTWEPRSTFTPQLEWSLRMTSQVLQGLADCWRKAIIHLDIKPANIALDHGDIVKLIDFGLAKVALGPSGTGTSGFPGYTLFYAAPEQIEQRPKKGWWSSACDVRATGATLYEILTGLPPMEREAQQHGLLGDSGIPPVRTKDFLDLLRAQPPIRPITLLPGLPQIVDDFVMHLLEPDRRHRPRDVVAAAAELREVTEAITGTDAEYLPVGWRHVLDGRQGEEGA